MPNMQSHLLPLPFFFFPRFHENYFTSWEKKKWISKSS